MVELMLIYQSTNQCRHFHVTWQSCAWLLLPVYNDKKSDKKSGLHPRENFSDIGVVISYIQRCLESPFGYRSMHQKLIEKKFRVNRETVRLILKTLDPVGLDARRRKTLRRRIYRNSGPNSFGMPMDTINSNLLVSQFTDV